MEPSAAGAPAGAGDGHRRAVGASIAVTERLFTMVTIPSKYLYFAAPAGVILIIVGILLARGCRSEPAPVVAEPEAVSITRADILAAARIEAEDDRLASDPQPYDAGSRGALPELEGAAGFEPLRARTVRFALTARAGSVPLILRNGGAAAGESWAAPGGEPFKVELVRIDDPVAMGDAIAAGRIHAAWASLDMLPLLAERLGGDERSLPRVMQQLGWSAGSDGIVMRRSHAADPKLPRIADLRGEKIVLVQDSPSGFAVVNSLLDGGVQPGEVEIVHAQDAFEAVAVFQADHSIAACAGWTPEFHQLCGSPEHCLLDATGRRSRSTADVWFARADFARDHPQICEGLVRGVFEGLAALAETGGADEAASLMAALFGLAADECRVLVDLAEPADLRMNRDFFLDRAHPTNFERNWAMACDVQRHLGMIAEPLSFDRVIDGSIIDRLVAAGSGMEEPGDSMARPVRRLIKVSDLGDAKGLAPGVVVHFAPNSWDPRMSVGRETDSEEAELPCEPGLDATLEDVVGTIGRFEHPRVIIEGHSDASRKGEVDAQFARDLARQRAEAVAEMLREMLPELEPDQVVVEAAGWDQPMDPAVQDFVFDRRVEITVVEKGREEE